MTQLLIFWYGFRIWLAEDRKESLREQLRFFGETYPAIRENTLRLIEREDETITRAQERLEQLEARRAQA